MPAATETPQRVPPIEVLLGNGGKTMPDAAAAHWQACRLCTHLMASGTERDPWTGRVVPQRLSEALTGLSAAIDAGMPATPAEALVRIAEHCADALHDIVRQPRQRLQRQHELRPLHRVREVDATTMAWLSRQAGETIAEKLGRQQRALTLVRRPVLNLPENRLVGHFVCSLHRLLDKSLAEAAALGEDASTGDVQRRRTLLRAQRGCTMAAEAGFDDLATHPVRRPNNTLLADRNYHRIWQGWMWLGALGEDLARSWRDAAERFAELGLWALVAAMRSRTAVHMEDCCVLREPGFAGEPFGIHAPDGSALTVSLFVTLPRRVKALVRLSRDGDAIIIDQHELSGTSSLLGVGRATSFRVRLVADPHAAEPNQPVALQVWLYSDGVAAENLGAVIADAGGWQTIAEVLTDSILRAAPRRTRPPGPADPTLIGLDASGSVPRLVGDGVALASRSLLAMGDYRHRRARWRSAGVVDRRFPATPDGGDWVSAPSVLATLGRKQDPPPGTIETLGAIFAALWTASLTEPPANRSSWRRSLAVATSALLPEPAQRWLRQAAVAGGGFDRCWLVERTTAAALGWQTQPDFPRDHLRSGNRILIVDAEAGALRVAALRAGRAGDRPDIQPHRQMYWIRDMADQPAPPAPGVTGRDWLTDYLAHALEPARREGLLSPAECAAMIERLVEQGEAERMLDYAGILHLPLPAGRDPPRSVLQLAFDPATANRAASDWCGRYQAQLQAQAGTLARLLDHWSGSSAQHGNARRVMWNVLYVGSPFHQRPIRERLLTAWRVIETACDGRHTFYHHALPTAHRLVAAGCAEFLARQHADPPMQSWRDLPQEQYLEAELEQGSQRVRIVSRTPRSPGEQVAEIIEGLELPAGEERYLLPVLTGGEEDATYRHCALLRPPGFPLGHDQPVRLHVRYCYGEDDYRLFVEPVLAADAAKPPFQEVEAQWINVLNTPPRFTAPDPRLEQWRTQALANVYRASDLLGLDRSALSSLTASLSPATEATPAAASGIWLPALETMVSDDWQGVLFAARALAGCVGALLVPPSPSLLAMLVAALKHTDPRLANEAMRLLRALLRDPTDPSQAAALCGIVAVAEQRSLGVSQQFPVRAGRLPRFDRLTVPLGAIAGILLHRERFLTVLATAELELLRGIARRCLREMAEVLTAASADVDADYATRCFTAFRAISEMLAGLLQSRAVARDYPEQAALFEAGDPHVHELARQINRVDGLLMALLQRLDVEAPRSQIVPYGSGVAHRVMWPLSRLLHELLAGYAPQRLIGLAPESAEEVDA